MNKLFKLTAIAAAMGACFSAPAFADSASSTGGLKIKSDDGRFEAALGGRLHFDGNMVDEDVTDNSKKGGANDQVTNGLFMRRAYVTLAGKVYDYKYKLEFDVAGGVSGSKELWLGHDLLGGFLKAGHMQPAYGMEELTSSNEILFMERPFISNNGVFKGREFQNGIGYTRNFLDNMLLANVTVYDGGTGSDGNTGAAQEGRGVAARLTAAPINTDDATLHVGLSIDSIDYNTLAGGPAMDISYLSKNGPKTSLKPFDGTVKGLVKAGSYDTQDTYTGELAGKIGPFYAQAEYSSSDLGGGKGNFDQSLESYYVQASYFITGESKVYKAANGVFGNAKPAVANEWGAWEVKARYDVMKNKDADKYALPNVAEKLQTTGFGVNWYPNSNVRFMLEYLMGQAKTVGGDKDKPNAITARAQVSF